MPEFKVFSEYTPAGDQPQAIQALSQGIELGLDEQTLLGVTGSGNSRAPMVIMLLSFVLFRQCYLYVMSNFISNTILPLAMGYPAGWLVCSTITLIYYRRVQMDRSKLSLD